MTDSLPAFTVCPCQTEADRLAAMHIRFAVFVDEQKVPADLEPDEYDTDAHHLIAQTDDGLPVGTLRVVDKGNGAAKIGRVAVLAPYRGLGVGNLLMQFAENYARQAGFASLILDAQLQVLGFYKKRGYVASGPVFDDAGIDHRRMTLVLSP